MGLINVTNSHIILRDVDQYYLTQRFTITKTIFNNNPLAYGIYDSPGVKFENLEIKY